MSANSCLLEECPNPIDRRGYCSKHYTRVKRYGDPYFTKMPTKGLPEAERFWYHVNKSGPVHPLLGQCWIWTAYTEDGYGRFGLDGGKLALAHRYGYAKYVGPIDDDLELDHLCKNRSCVNPDHLEAVTHQSNCLRSDNICGRQSRKTHCRRGHLLEGTNLRSSRDGHRRCRACRKINDALRKQFKPEFVLRLADECGWICWRCDEPIDPTLEYPDPRYRSIDHIIDVTLGGGNERANLQISHLGCNSGAGAAMAWKMGWVVQDVRKAQISNGEM